MPHLVQGFASKVKEKKRIKEEYKVKGKLGFQVARESRLETLPSSICFCFRLYSVSFQGVLWFGLVLRNFCIKEMPGL